MLKESTPSEREPVEWLKALDIVRLNGRWAQVTSDVAPDPSSVPVHYLDGKPGEFVNFLKMRLMGRIDHVVKVARKSAGLQFTEAEIANIYWGPEAGQEFHLKEEVTVFGEYVSV